MPTHKFRVGQTVGLAPTEAGDPATRTIYKVLGRLSGESSELMYRIKTIREAGYRLVPESQLVCAATRQREAGALIISATERRAWSGRAPGRLL